MTIIDIIFDIIIGAVFIFVVGVILGIAIEKKASKLNTHDIDQKTWERIEGWRK